MKKLSNKDNHSKKKQVNNYQKCKNKKYLIKTCHI